MLVFLVNNKKGRSEALCLRINGDRAVFSKGLYVPHESRFIPDDPKILNSNSIYTSGEEKIELGNKIFNLFDVIYKDEDQTTLNEYLIDNQDDQYDSDHEELVSDDVVEDVELTYNVMLSALSMIMTYKKEADEIKSLIDVETDLEKESNLRSALISVSEQAYSVFNNIKPDMLYNENHLPMGALAESYDVFISEVKQFAQNVYGNLQDDLKQIDDELFLVENEEGAVDLLEKKEPILDNISKVQNILMALEDVSCLTFVQKFQEDERSDENEDVVSTDLSDEETITDEKDEQIDSSHDVSGYEDNPVEAIPLIKVSLMDSTQKWRSFWIPADHSLIKGNMVDRSECMKCGWDSQSHPNISENGVAEKYCCLGLSKYITINKTVMGLPELSDPIYGWAEDAPQESNRTVDNDQLISKKLRFLNIAASLNDPFYKSQTKELSQEMRKILNEIVPELKDNPGMHVNVLQIAEDVLDDAFLPGYTYVDKGMRYVRVKNLIEKFPFKETDSEQIEKIKEKLVTLNSQLKEMKDKFDNRRV